MKEDIVYRNLLGINSLALGSLGVGGGMMIKALLTSEKTKIEKPNP